MTLLQIWAAAAAVASLPAADPATDARAMFAQYESYTQAFDTRIADLYAPDAVIVARRGGATRLFRGDQWQLLIRAGMAIARQRNDLDSFQDVRTRWLPDGTVELRATRYNHLKAYASPYRVILARRGTAWLIVREEIESRP